MTTIRREGGHRSQAPGHLRRGFLFTLGFVLSPASWWNDAVVNLPIAWLLASLAEAVLPGSYVGAFLMVYWLTNIAGFALMHIAGAPLFPRRRWGAALVLAGSAVYTVAFFLLLRHRIIPPIPFRIR